MIIHLYLNDKELKQEIADDMLLLDFLRDNQCYSVKGGCETSNCGLCTVLVEDKPVLSCSTLAARVDGKHVVTLEGLQEEASELGAFLADQGADQCGFCSPGLVISILAMKKELDHPSDEEIKEYLAGNLCRCTGYMSQLRGIKQYFSECRFHSPSQSEGSTEK
ncbi:(2Fe-2S)-binding protein [Acetobacterium sp.]|uniref:(2Fe-2S)-binding protein n=1 Tax=Acetobacterium sp. TaxID=1872094 RepID=UPI002F418961